MKKITCMLLVIQSGFMMAQTKTVVTQNGEKVAISASANNGLTTNSGYIQLGGALTKPSVLTTTSAFTLAIQGLEAGTASDNVLVSDANGVLKYVPRANFTGADNLGNHTATQNLMMNRNDVVIADRLASNNNTFSIYKDSGFLGIWNNLKNGNALTIDETTNKTTLASAQISKGTDGSTPAIGSVAVSADTNGNVKWVSPSSLGSGDNLGNHTATTDLAMSGKNINNAANITAIGKTTTNTAQIAKGTNGVTPQAGYLATSADTSGNIVWIAATSAPGAIDGIYEFLGTNQVNIPANTTATVPMNGNSFKLNKSGKVLITYSLLPLPITSGKPVQGSIDLMVDGTKTISSYYSAHDAPAGLVNLGNYSTAQKIMSLPAGNHTVGLNVKSWFNTTITNVNPYPSYAGATSNDTQAMVARITVIIFND